MPRVHKKSSELEAVYYADVNPPESRHLSGRYHCRRRRYKLRTVSWIIDTITAKAVLILGRFSKERKAVLDAIREELRKHNYLPIMFDFPPSCSRATLRRSKRWLVWHGLWFADLTDAKSVLQELQAIVPDFPSVAVRILIKRGQYEPGMLDFIRRFPWVIEDAYEYEDEKGVITSIKDHVIVPAEAKVRKLRKCE
jgi:hypothetical protein